MAISKDTKRAIVAKVTDALTRASAVLFVGFTKLSVADSAQLRQELAREDVHYAVVKKTLLRHALTDCNYDGSHPDLPGEVAIAWTEGDDETAPARGVYDFGKKLKGALTLLGGIFGGTLIDAERATALATIPPMPILRGMFVNVINSPIQGLVVALDKIREQKTN